MTAASGSTGPDPTARQGARREARESALVLLYEADVRGTSPAEVLASQVLGPSPYTVTLIEGVAEHRDELDAVIAAVAQGWTLARMPTIDRNLLRMAAYELLHRPDVPAGVVLSEAVELAGQYSTDDSGRFVNGVLARIAADVRGA